MTCLIPEIQQIQNFHADSLARIFLSIIHSFLVFLCQQAVLRQLFFINYKAICQLMIFNINSNLYLNIIYSLVVNTTTTTRLIYALRSAARHQLTYLDIVSALTVGGHLLSLVRRCLTLCLMIYEILQSAHRPSDSR